jgi:uncharacterized membrane protein YkvA (DUF1232 family)
MRRLLMLWRLVRRDLGVLRAAIGHPDRPAWLLPAAGIVLLYAIEPLNFAIPVLGFVDELVLVPLALHTIVRMLPEHVRVSS